MRAARVPLFSLENHVAAADFDVLAFNLSLSSSTRTWSIWWTSPGSHPRCRARRALPAGVAAALHLQPEPLADFVDAFVLGDGEEVVGRSTTCSPPTRRATPTAERSSRRSPRSRGLRPEPVRAALRGRPARRHRALSAGVPTWSRSAPSRTWPSGRTLAPAGPVTEVVHDRLNVEVFRGARAAVASARRDDHRRCASDRRPGARHGARGPRVERL